MGPHHDVSDPPGGWAVACPGQGVDPRDVAAVLDRHAGHPLVARLQDATGVQRWADADLTDTRRAQPAVFTASVLAAEAVAATGFPTIGAVGHSLGELAAAVAAGALDRDDGFDLVLTRAELGHRADADRPGQMVVVMRLPDVEVELARRWALGTAGGVLELAVRNGPGQQVLSGDAATVAVAMAKVAELGGVARRLPIGGAFHTPLMAGALEPFRAAVAAAARAPSGLWVSSTLGRVVESGAEVADALARALVLPVRWPDTNQVLVEHGVAGLVDVGPGTTLANLANHADLLPVRTAEAILTGRVDAS